MIHEAVEIDLKNSMPYWNGITPRMNLARHMPLQALYKRSIDVAVEEARDLQTDGLPTDDAILAVDWLFRSPDLHGDSVTFWMSFENACHVLGADTRRLRGNIRVYLRYQTIATAQAEQARAYVLLSQPLPGDEPELFEAIRCVPVLDQETLFPAEVIQ